MLDQIIDKIKWDEASWRKLQKLIVEKEIASKTILLKEGDIANQVFLIKKKPHRFWQGFLFLMTYG
jgi:hypothetical protein